MGKEQTSNRVKRLAARSFFYKVYVGASIRATHGCARQTLNSRHPLDADERIREKNKNKVCMGKDRQRRKAH